MPDFIQRLLLASESEVSSLNAQAALGSEQKTERSQFSHLFRHFIERFFNHETASPDGDAKARLVLIALTTGLPGFVVALYLWPEYHSFIPYMRNHRIIWVPGPPTYWAQVNQHFFYVVYSFVVMGIATIFEWDLFFPDLLDINVLGCLPVAAWRLFAARVTAIAVLIAGFLFDANFLAALVLPSAIDPPNLWRFLAGHILAAFASGLFASSFVLAFQGVLLAVLGERLFNRLSLLIQGFGIAVLLLLLLLFPLLSTLTPLVLRSDNVFGLFFPPLWFLGIYQRLMEGPTALPIFEKLAQIGWAALLGTAGIAVLAYPIAYVRKMRQILLGAPTHRTRSRLLHICNWLLNETFVKPPVRRAVFHFIGQTLFRVQRYRIHLVLYGGVGLSVVAATILRLEVIHQKVRIEISGDGTRAATAIVAFWIIAGLRMAFVSPGNRQGSWLFRIIHGRPPHFDSAVQQFFAAKLWVFLVAIFVTFGAYLGLRLIAPPEVLTLRATASQVLMNLAMCLLLTDILFLNVKIVAFTGGPAKEQSNLAVTLLKYFAFFPAVPWIPLTCEPWIESDVTHFAFVAALVAGVHLALKRQNRKVIQEYCDMYCPDEDQEEFLLTLGLRF